MVRQHYSGSYTEASLQSRGEAYTAKFDGKCVSLLNEAPWYEGIWKEEV
jgi:hypothetical protein